MRATGCSTQVDATQCFVCNYRSGVPELDHAIAERRDALLAELVRDSCARRACVSEYVHWRHAFIFDAFLKTAAHDAHAKKVMVRALQALGGTTADVVVADPGWWHTWRVTAVPAARVAKLIQHRDADSFACTNTPLFFVTSVLDPVWVRGQTRMTAWKCAANVLLAHAQ